MQDRPTASPSDELDTVPDTVSPAYASAHPLTRAFDRFASAVTRWAGSPLSFTVAVLSIVVWIVTGPLFHYSDGWQLVINTGTTIVTFLMVFLIQQSQNKDSIAVHLKLNELLAAQRNASNRLIGIEDASEDELRKLAAAYLRMASAPDATVPSDGDDDGAVQRTASRTSNESTVSNAADAPSNDAGSPKKDTAKEDARVANQNAEAMARKCDDRG
ncbi:low affinity iron permease family protein [Paraburkholderia sp.]|uniref:low affinity iron permease family protein n=1 Tax=Paraburkholderia sp. TaxID=1926495 RepID=UPI0023858428|nr:low affinity iron permease family protein [Paraburkholderia sp.]MDE1181694.1 low affinity iron permease family protein [Paraburkholderia sp.]